MSTAPDFELVFDELDEDEPSVSEAMELWAYLENPREMLEAGREERDRGGS